MYRLTLLLSFVVIHAGVSWPLAALLARHHHTVLAEREAATGRLTVGDYFDAGLGAAVAGPGAFIVATLVAFMLWRWTGLMTVVGCDDDEHCGDDCDDCGGCDGGGGSGGGSGGSLRPRDA